MTRSVPSRDAARPERWCLGTPAFVGVAAIVATGYSAFAWSVGPVTWFDQADSREDLANRVDSEVVEQVACHSGKGRCNVIKHNP